MERPRIVIKSELKPVFEKIFQEAWGNPILFQTTPTNDTMKGNTWGLYSGYLYMKFADNTSWKIQLTSVT